MSTFLYLSSCSTCKRIMGELNLEETKIQDIKTTPIQEDQLDQLFKVSGSYEALFNKRAQKYKTEGLNQKSLTEKDFKDLILQEYTFLKRPALIHPKAIVAGNSKAVIEEMKKALNE